MQTGWLSLSISRQNLTQHNRANNDGIIYLLFVSIGAWQLWRMHTQESVFDRSAGRLTKGGKTHDLCQICAIQLIREFVRENKKVTTATNLIMYTPMENESILQNTDLFMQFASMPRLYPIVYRFRRGMPLTIEFQNQQENWISSMSL